MSGSVERNYPLILALSGGTMFFLFNGGDVGEAVAMAFGCLILTSFLLVSSLLISCLLVTLGKEGFVAGMRQTGAFDALMEYRRSCMLWNASTAAISFIPIIIGESGVVFMSILCGLLCGSFGSAWRAISLQERVIDNCMDTE